MYICKCMGGVRFKYYDYDNHMYNSVLNYFCVSLGIPYVVTIHTGDKRNAGTDAQVYIVMYNKTSSSSKIFLSGGKFERKSIDTITIDGPEDLSPLTEIDIGHDNSGFGPGWFLDKVC